MPAKRSYALSIAGFDPSAGAGILADIKTFESNKVYGLGVCTAFTIQDDHSFESVHWTEADKIIAQIEVLAKRFRFDYVKIGLIESIDILERTIDCLLAGNKKIRIIWDPIMRASAGFEFHSSVRKEILERICKKIYLLTPNREEIKGLLPGMEEGRAAQELAQHCAVLLKGGHHETDKGRDYLYAKGKVYPFRSKKTVVYPKHGSGCVLSAAIVAYLAKGYKLHPACLRAKGYITWFLLSNKELLGYHKL